MTLREPKRPNGPGASAAACAALCAAFSLLVFAPVDTYAANRTDLTFTLAQLWWGLAILFVAGAALMWAALWLARRLSRTLGDALTLALAGLTLAFNVQGNVLSIGAAQLSGDELTYALSLWPTLLNAALWLALVALPVALYFVMRKRKPGGADKCVAGARMACLVLLAAQVFSLGAVVAGLLPEEQHAYLLTKKDEFALSDSDNTVVFILDNVGEPTLGEALEQSPQLMRELTGFTRFTNTVSAYRNTSGAFAHFMTGEHYLNRQTFAAFTREAFERDAFWRELRAMGYTVFIGESGIASVPFEAYQTEWFQNLAPFSIHVPSEYTLVKRMMHLTLFRFAPEAARPYLYIHRLLQHVENAASLIPLDGGEHFQKANGDFRDDLREQGLRAGPGKRFSLYFLSGAHSPLDVDERGEDTEPYEGDWTRATRGSLTIVCEYLARMKALGLYDGANVVIMSDHGTKLYSGEIVNPILLVKPAGAAGEMTASAVPACFDDLRATLMSLMGGDSTRYGRSVFELREGEERERLYYYYDWSRSMSSEIYFTPITEYAASPDGKTYAPTGNVYAR